MSWKGHTFTKENAPARIKARGGPALEEWLNEQTARNAVVAVDPSASTGKSLIIAEELQQRILNKLSEKGRRIGPLLLRMTKTDRVQLLAAFDTDGNLRNPFKKV